MHSANKPYKLTQQTSNPQPNTREHMKTPDLKISINLGEAYNDPARFVKCAVVADKYGFDTVWFGDHLLPWIHSHNRSAFVWSVMPVALDRTKRVNVGVLVTSPIGGRYHPLIIGQAAATIDNMYPGRFRLGVGSGEAVNENNFFPEGWPKWPKRIGRPSRIRRANAENVEKRRIFRLSGRILQGGQILFVYETKDGNTGIFCCPGKKSRSHSRSSRRPPGNHQQPSDMPRRDFPSFRASSKTSRQGPSKDGKNGRSPPLLRRQKHRNQRNSKVRRSRLSSQRRLQRSRPQENPKHVLHCGRRNNRKALALRHLTRRPHQNNRTIPASRRHTHRTSHTLTPRQNRTHRQKNPTTLQNPKTRQHAKLPLNPLNHTKPQYSQTSKVIPEN